MTRDEIIRMAREAGMEVHERKGEIRIGSAVITGCDSTEQVTRFAALVAAAERDRVCKIVYGKCISDNNAFEIVQAIKAVTEKGASNYAAERNDNTG